MPGHRPAAILDSVHRGDPAHVVIAGGGFAALEAAVALRAMAADRVRLSVVAPEPRFAYRPAATGEVFSQRPPRIYDLRTLLNGLAAEHLSTRLEAVTPDRKSVRLATGARLPYDVLILALGARSQAGIPGALTFRDQRDVPKVRGIVAAVRAGELRQLIFAVPSQHSWSLPAYELALLAASQFKREAQRAQVTIATPEPAPLNVFGAEAAAVVGELLAARGVRFVGGVTPHAVSRDGSLELEFDAPLEADAVLAIPQLRGNRLPGLPASWLGFIPTDAVGRVPGLRDVYAAGDITTFPIKQGGLGAQQADRIAHTIACELGAPVHELHPARVLEAQLLAGTERLFLRAELDEFGQPVSPVIQRLEHADAPPAAKVSARYLTPYLARHSRPAALQAA